MPATAEDPTSRQAQGALRIGDVARLAGTTPRTIRYYEEIGLLPEAAGRPSGGHRLYTEAEVERLREVMRLKELLGLTLEELKELLAAEEARAEVRAELRREDVAPERRRELLEEAARPHRPPARARPPPRRRAGKAPRGADRHAQARPPQDPRARRAGRGRVPAGARRGLERPALSRQLPGRGCHGVRSR